jgi:hypothetical protein
MNSGAMIIIIKKIMKIKTLFLLFLLIHFNIQGQQKTSNNSPCKELKGIILYRSSTPENIIYREKLTYNQSMDEIGWINRIKKNNFGFPNFEKEAIEKIYKKIDSLKTSDNQNSEELYHIIITKIVDTFLTEEDRQYMLQQIKAATNEKWKLSKNKIKFSDAIAAIKISEPYFNKNGTKAIVFVKTPTLEKADFYRWMNGEWNFYFSSLLWIE